MVNQHGAPCALIVKAESMEYFICIIIFFLRREKVRQLADDVSKCEEEIRRLQSSRKDRLEAFGQWMPRLVAALQQNQSRFRKLPKGPIGALMKLKDYRWATAVEQVVGYRNLISFVCDNHDDEVILRRLVNENTRDVRGPRPDIIVTRFTVMFYSLCHKILTMQN